MTLVPDNPSASPRPLRLWPGVVLVLLQWLLWLIIRFTMPGGGVIAVLGAVACGLGIFSWWLFFSRARWLERVGALALIAVAVTASYPLVHPSISNGMMGRMLALYSIPVMSQALVVWAAATRGLSGWHRPASMAIAIALACGALMLARTGGVSGDGESDLHWRWTQTPEERLLAQGARAPAPSAPVSAPAPAAADPTSNPAVRPPSDPSSTAPATAAPEKAAAVPVDGLKPPADDPARTDAVAAWPGFRGPARDGVVRGTRLETDWSRRPPILLWRRAVGPGWSSFAVDGDRIFTQEQRGEEEVVSCYRLTTGEPVWLHGDRVRFWESNAGAGPRATPTLHGGRVYTMGATGVVNALDAATGSRIWTRNPASETGKDTPEWGFASSPLAVDDVVIVAAAGQLVGYDARTGERRWVGPAEGGGYSSPHLVTIAGVQQVLLPRGRRTTSVAPADGTVLWEDSWQPATSLLQPAVAGDGDVVIAAGDMMGGVGLRRIAVAQGGAGWTVQERWSSRGLKPYFNDFVVHEGHAYGFDGSILASVDLADGARKWKGGRYGHGQLLLLADQDLLLVLSETGDLALVQAAPDKFTELARVPAIEGKTWNHPVLVGNLLLVRNDQEMAAFRLPVAGQTATRPER
jgi:outer membrane protein assembly factor BamB